MSELIEEQNSVVDIRKNRIKSQLISQIYKTGKMPINKMARLIHASIPSVTNIINDLHHEGWLSEIDVKLATSGRPPTFYDLNPSKYYTLLLDINRHETQFVVLDLSNEIVYQRTISLTLTNTPTFLDSLFMAANQFLTDHMLSLSRIWGVGVAMPGLIDSRCGINKSYARLTAPNETIIGWLEMNFQCPAYLINDTQATTLGEYRFGLAQDCSHALTINIDWGVGMGILINGTVFNGASGFAGELGHILARPDGELCYCGKRGCVDTITSAFALIEQAKRGIRAGQKTHLTRMSAAEKLEALHIIEAAHKGDAFSAGLLYEIGTELGKALAVAVQLFNPEVIIVSGVLANAGKFVVDPLDAAIREHALPDFLERLDIRMSYLGSKARLLGAQAHLIDFLIEREFS